MSSKLGLLLALTFLTLQVVSSSSRWKYIFFKNKKKSTTPKYQDIHNPSEATLPVKNQLINNPNELPPESSFQKTRWYQCWILRSQRKVSSDITRLILSYLTFVPVTSPLYPPSNGLKEAVLSRNRRWLLSTTNDDNLHLLDLSNGERVRTFTVPTRHLWSCAIADNHSFVAGGGYANIYVWNTSTEKLVTTLTGHTSTIYTCSIFFNDTRLASGSYDQTVRVWQVEHCQWKSLYVLNGHTDWIQSIYTLADNPWIISFAWDKTLRVWNSDTGQCLHILTGHTNLPYDHSCVMSLDQRLIGSIDRMARETKLWNITTGTCTLTIPNISGCSDCNYHIVYLSTEQLVWWQADQGRSKVGVWNLRANKNYTLLFEVQIKLVNVSADGKYLIIVLNKDNTEYAFVEVYDIETGILIKS